MINREIILFQNHPEQFLISQIIDCSIFHFREIVKRCGTFASNIYPYHFFMSIDDAKHGLELEKRNVTMLQSVMASCFLNTSLSMDM